MKGRRGTQSASTSQSVLPVCARESTRAEKRWFEGSREVLLDIKAMAVIHTELTEFISHRDRQASTEPS